MNDPNPHPAGGAGGATTPAQSPPTGVPPAATFVKAAMDAGPPIGGRFLLAALALALFGGLTISSKPAGIALAIVGCGLALLAATTVAGRDRFSAACFGSAALLALTPAVRDAEWVTILACCAAFLLASIGAARATTWRELVAGLWEWLPAVITAPIRLIAEAVRRSTTERLERLGPVLRGTLLAIVLLSVFGALFASADAAFAHFTRRLTDLHLSSTTITLDAIYFVLVLTVAGALRHVAVTRTARPPMPAKRQLGNVEWVIALGSLVALFAAFVALQLTTLFGGDDHVLRTAGLTYAEYARAGFGQLAFAAALTLLVIAAAARYGPAGDRVVRGLVGALCVLTVVLLISALHRLGLYEDAYGTTRMRFLVHGWLVWLGAVFVTIVIAGALHRTAVLPRAAVLITAVAALVFVAANPDGRIASRNIDRVAAGHTLDAWYLASLSVDAVPSLQALPRRTAACLATSFSQEIDPHEHVASLNLSRARARDRFTDLGARRELSPSCQRLLWG